MTTRAVDLLARLREDCLDDLVGAEEGTMLFSDDTLLRALSAAQREIARRLMCLYDDATPEICQLPVTLPADWQTAPHYTEFPLDPRILRVERVFFPGIHHPLRRLEGNTDFPPADLVREYGPFHSFWGSDAFFTYPGRLIVTRRPQVAGTMRLAVRRLPLKDLKPSAGSTLELSYMDEAVCFAAARDLFGKPDAESYDPQLAVKWGARFETALDQLKDAQAQEAPRVRAMRAEPF